MGQKVLGKHPFGPNEPRFMGPKTQVTLSAKMGQKGPFLNIKKNGFRVLALKWAKHGVFIYLRVPEESQKHNKDIGNGSNPFWKIFFFDFFPYKITPPVKKKTEPNPTL